MIATAAIEVIRLLTFLALLGHIDTHRMQDMHLFLSVALGLSAQIATAGHFCAHRPQDVQLESAFGIMPAPAFLYGLLPGT